MAESDRPVRRSARKQTGHGEPGDPEQQARHPVGPPPPPGPREGGPPAPRPVGPPPRGPLAFLEQAQDVMTVRRVFGEPIERDGVIIIPAARVRGGGGGGFGEGPQGQGGRGGGGGFGVGAGPAGAYVIRDGVVTWKPAVDATRIAIMGQVVAIVFLLTIRSVVKALAKRR